MLFLFQFILVCFLSMLHCAVKVKGWLDTATRLKSIHADDKGIFRLFQYLIVFSVLISLLNLATISQGFVFFSHNSAIYIAGEIYFLFMLVIISTLRNFTTRKSKLDVVVSTPASFQCSCCKSSYDYLLVYRWN